MEKKPETKKKKPIATSAGFYYCPNCRKNVGYTKEGKEYRANYCYNCGQEIDWSEEEGS